MSTTQITLDCTRTVNDIVAEHPATVAVFTAFGVDTCCGGKHSVEEVVRRHGIDAPTLCEALSEAVRAG